MIVVGLTGGIGSGKSTVSAGLGHRGAIVIDADAITKELQQPGQPVLRAIVERFGLEVLNVDGSLKRQTLADMVFTNPDALKDLNGIVHPAVGLEVAARLERERDTGRVVVLDVPLLVESSRYHVSGVIVVDTSAEIAVKRLVEHRGLRPDDARARMSRQASREERLTRADFVIDNSGSPADLEPQVAAAWDWIGSLAPVANNRSLG